MVYSSTATCTATRLSGAWIAAWAFAQICLVLAAVALVPAVSAPTPSPATSPTRAARGSSARAVTLKSPSPAPASQVVAGPAKPEPTPSDVPRFYAALHVGDAWLVLHRLAPSEPRAPAVAGAVRAVPLTHGQAVLLTHLGPASHPGYTLVAGGETCSTRAVGQVRLELDSGDPGNDSALGPAWIADEVAPCSLKHQPPTPFVAIAGKSQSYPEPTLAPLHVAQRVKFDPAAPSDCEANAEVLEAQLEIAGRSFEVTRVSGDPDALRVIELGGSVALSTRAALTWDSAGVGC